MSPQLTNNRTFPFVLLIIASCVVFAIAQQDYDAFPNDPQFARAYDAAVRTAQQVYGLSEKDARTFAKIVHMHTNLLTKSGKLMEWHTNSKRTNPPPDCPSLPQIPPTDDINNLHPQHVKIVGALGDSITAGFAAKSTSLFNLEEFRGLSWSIGGDQDESTAATILREFSPDLFGFSLGEGDRSENKQTHFNAAVSGAIVQDLPSQADWLIENMKLSISNDSFFNDWKMVTIWIGGNNLCRYCNDQSKHSPDQYEHNINITLSKLAQLPRTFVNLVPTLDITELDEFQSYLCAVLHYYECYCATHNDDTKSQVKEALAEYNNRLFKLEREYPRTKEFAVVVQPFLINTDIPDRSYLSPADCFHPSHKSHDAIGTALWNSLLTPASEKKTSWNATDTIQCPTVDSRLMTN